MPPYSHHLLHNRRENHFKNGNSDWKGIEEYTVVDKTTVKLSARRSWMELSIAKF